MFSKKVFASLIIITWLVLLVFAAATNIHYIDQKVCTQCGVCVEECPEGAIEVIEKDGKEINVINQEKCTQCGVCIDACPEEAILVGEPGKEAQDVDK